MELGRILVADDDLSVRECIRFVLEKEGATVFEATNGTELYESLRGEGRFDVVVADVLMPPPTGLRVLALMRKAGVMVPFVLTTGLDDPDLRRSAAELGNAEMLAKPFLPRDLVGVVRRLLGREEPSGAADEPGAG